MDFPKEEEKILEFWRSVDAFHTCLKQSHGKPRFTFYDGPPFATGLPHYGHILAGTIKDIIPRWMHQHGHHVERRFGWDTHGLPVEYEIDKTLNIKGPEDVAKMGIAKYNDECRKIVMRYSGEWEKTVARLGRWIDFKNDYKTMYPWYMESLWWVFKQLWDKGLIYQGFRVMPYSTGCCTPIANFEASQNYKDVQDPAVTVSFPLDDDPKVSLIAWTTTPWTLPSNMALCVHPEHEYVKIKDKSTNNVYIMMEARIPALFKSEDDYEVLDKFVGQSLKGKGYKPLFPYFEQYKKKGAFKVLVDTYVTQDSGTGVVHQAPYFGEDDNRVCLAHGVITKEQDIICPLDGMGKFVKPVTDFEGEYVKDADKNIIKMIKEMGRLVHASQITHSYPFCWRSDTPLLYRAVPSWFMRVERMQQDLLKKNSETYWVPETIKEGRFANWLKDARDWNLSRNRYWGTPIPVWQSEDGEESVCIGSIEQLETLSGVTGIKDLHRETIDKITIPSSRPGKPALKRISEVFDCWFESGSMPYAQMHYPFERKKEFEDTFPADFIAEGTDQTRGWFYTLLVLSTALFDKPAYKNLIVNGLVLASDGQKMSKSKKNYPDPNIVIGKYGADALRLYLINSPVVKAESLRFKEDGVRDILKDVFLPWYNAYKFLLQNIDSYQDRTGKTFSWSEDCLGKSDNVMDNWILSFTQSLLVYVKQEMAAYRLYTVLPRLMKFIDNLTNWYVRTNRKRLKGEVANTTDNDCEQALETLFSVLFTMVRVFAPFTPFLTEHMYQKLRPMIQGYMDKKDTVSVHYLMIPSPRNDLIDENIERSVARMQAVVELGRVVRDRRTMPVKYPLPELVVIHKDQECLDDVLSLEDYVLEELNIKKLTLSTNKEQYGVNLRAEPDHKTLGLRLRGDFKNVTKEIKALDDVKVSEFVAKGEIEVLGHKLGPGDLRVMYTFGGDNPALAEKYEAHSDNDILILLDCTPDQSMIDEGISREVTNRVQKLRKKAGLVPSDEVTVYFQLSPADHDLGRIINEYEESIELTTKSPIKLWNASVSSKVIAKEDYELKGAKMTLTIVQGFSSGRSGVSKVVEVSTNGNPNCKFVNVVLENQVGTILLENPVGQNKITSYNQLAQEVESLFARNDVALFSDNSCSGKLEFDFASSSGNTVYGKTASGSMPRVKISSKGSACKFVQVSDSSSGKNGTLLIENPVQYPLGNYAGDALRAIFGKDKLFEEKAKKNAVKSDKLTKLNGKLVYV